MGNDYIVGFEFTCENCPHFDDLNKTCWAFNGKFGENINPEWDFCEWGRNNYYNKEEED